MMQIWDDAIQTCKDLANDNTATAQTFFTRIMNLGYKYCLAELGRPNVEKTEQLSTRAPSSPLIESDRSYQVPADFNFLKSFKITIGSQNFPIMEEESQEMWDYRTRVLQTGILSLYFVRKGLVLGGAEILIDPIPAASGYTITMVYEATDKDLSQLQYATGTAKVTNASDQVVITGG